ncbi:MAG: glycosyl hydrolase 53 family protein [Lachnobacterium sp.]|nr:glycosyl hydrolase 53 family protein [Lachnobacterium sp.]
MKERKTWQKRIVSLLMALAMVVTQIGVWNAGKESVQAAETEATSIIQNGDFEEELSGWTLEGITTGNYAVKYSTGHNTNDFEVWCSSSEDITFTLSQEVTIPAGTYTLSVSSAGNAQLASICIGDLRTLTPDWSSFSEGNDAVKKTSDQFCVAEEVTVNVAITGTLPATWGGFYLDDIVLNQIVNEDTGESEDTDKSKLESLVQKAPSTLTGFETKLAENVQTTLAAANECLTKENATTEEINACYNALEAALSSLTYSDDEIQIEKVNGLNERTDFIKGIDISTYLVETASGVKYKDQSGQEVEGEEFIRMFAQNGVNYIRLRVWNQPYDTDSSGNKLYYGGGNNDIEMAVKICQLIKEYNTAYANTYGEVKVLIDLHYSDFWADPDKQTAPKAWKNMTIEDKTKAVAEFTKDCLEKVEATGVTVGMLQIGNETNNGICGESYGTNNYLAIFKAGCDAVKEYNESKKYTTENGKWIKRVVHFTDPQSVGTSKALYLKTGDLSAKDAANPTSKGVEYDVYATSYYPFWHGTTENLNKMLGNIASTCGCEVMVAETQYVYTNADYDGADNQAYEGKNNIDLSQWPVSVQGQANEIRDVIDAVAQVDDNKGIGMFYWEPAWLGVGNAYNEDGTVNESALNFNKTKWNQYGSGWASDYAGTYDAQAEKWGGGGTNNENASLFDFKGNPLASLNVFKYVNYGAVAKNKSFYTSDALGDVVVKMRDSKDAIKNKLAKTVAYTYNDETPGTANITWDETSLAKAEQEISMTKAIGNSYTITGTIDVDGTKQKVSCNILVDPSENLLENGGFENAIGNEWKFATGKQLWHAFASANPDANTRNSSGGSVILNSIKSDEKDADDSGCYSDSVSQSVELQAGVYEAKAFFEGADKAGSYDGEAINLSVTDANGVAKVSNAIKLDGWKVWQCATVSNIVVTQDMINSGKNTVTVSANVCIKKGVWGSIDDVYLYKVGEVTASGNGGSSTVTPSAPSAPNDTNTDTKDDNKKEDQKDDPKDVVTEEKNITATTPSGKKVEATVTVSKDKDGNVTEASAKVAGTKAAISAETAKELAKAAGTDRIAITASVTDKNGNEKYTVTVDSKNLTANKKLHVVAVDPKTGEYKLVNAKTYKVGKDGTLNVKLADGADYKMLTAAELKAVEKSILKTVEVKKPSVTVKNGKKTQIQLSSALDMDNVKSITYKTSKKSVASVSKSGKITTNKKGTATIKAIVTLKNGKKKTVSMTLKVK